MSGTTTVGGVAPTLFKYPTISSILAVAQSAAVSLPAVPLVSCVCALPALTVTVCSWIT